MTKSISVPEQLTLSQRKQCLAQAARIFEEPVDATNFKLYTFPLLLFNRLSDAYDEEYGIAHCS